MKKILFIILLLTYYSYSDELSKFNIGVYSDAYISLDNDYIPNAWEVESTDFNPRQFTFINAKRNQFDINIAQISASYDYNNFVRGKVTLQYGTLVSMAYGGFPLQEAYAGIQPVSGLWIDAGYFLTHIGAELFLPKDNWLSTHSIVTYFEPFYHSGVRANYTNGKLTAGLSLVNGNGIFQDNNENMSLGAFLSYQLTDDYLVSYASIFGNEEAGNTTNSKLHQLHNICFYANPLSFLNIKLHADYAMKDKIKQDNSTGSYLGLSAQARLLLSDKIHTTIRYSIVNDEDAVYGTGLIGSEATVGFEYVPISNSYIRIEGGFLNFDNGNGLGNVFSDKNGSQTNSRLGINFNFGFWFN